jgi:hypothetical protein
VKAPPPAPLGAELEREPDAPEQRSAELAGELEQATASWPSSRGERLELAIGRLVVDLNRAELHKRDTVTVSTADLRDVTRAAFVGSERDAKTGLDLAAVLDELAVELDTLCKRIAAIDSTNERPQTGGVFRG